MSQANVYTSANQLLWYTDKCAIVTGSTPVNYQVYATALGTAPAVGNIYSQPASVDADSQKQIYVGVGNYLTITGTGFTATELGTASSAQAGSGNFTEQLIPAPVVIPGGSALLNATPTQWLSVPNDSVFAQDTAFTYEGWFYPTSLTACYPFIMLQHNWIGVTYRNSGQFILDMSYVGVPPGYSAVGTTYPINNWYHIALTWTGTTGRLFVNGAQEATFTGAGATVADGNPLYIGQYQNQSFASFQGYVSNFRVVKGVAVYTAPFTPPTAPLTVTQAANENGTPSAAITGTQTALLLNTVPGADFLVDASVNAFTVVNNGAVTSSTANPF
jgi:hypothetical protein